MGALLPALRRQTGVALEILIADCGSTDGSREVAERHGALVVTAPKGRGAQMNAAVKRTAGEKLLFLHADADLLGNDHLLSDALAALKSAGDERTAGHFALTFLPGGPGYRYYEAKSETNRPETINGDQGLLLSRGFFQELGGFDERLPFLEDQALSKVIFQQGRWLLLPGRLGTSSRRFAAEGLARRMILSAVIMGLKELPDHPFFDHAGAIYREQNQTDRLRLAPFFSLIFRLNREAGLRRALKEWYGVGGYVRNNAWQLFFALDVRFGWSRRPLLRFHDRAVGPLLKLPPFDGITMVLTFLWFLLSWGFFALKDRP